MTPPPTDYVVEFVVVGKADGPRIVRPVPKVEFEIDEAPHAFGTEQPGAGLVVAEMVDEPAALVAVELVLDELADAGRAQGQLPGCSQAARSRKPSPLSSNMRFSKTPSRSLS
ncbi:hypothetical protein Aab01nite_21170 [Paractinoplanes abujensis]|nr:hypothetical protein Aab01nite_21170 [Actinoplanes abujensis]